MATKIDTLHPVNNLDDNLYPNIVKDNIPDHVIDETKITNEIMEKINNAVQLYGSQSVIGVLTFVNGLITDKINDIEVSNLVVKDDISNMVTTDTEQTISGNKTFSNIVIADGNNNFQVRTDNSQFSFMRFAVNNDSSKDGVIGLNGGLKYVDYNIDSNWHTFVGSDVNNMFTGTNTFNSPTLIKGKVILNTPNTSVIRNSNDSWLFGEDSTTDSLEINDVYSDNKTFISLWSRGRPYWHDGNAKNHNLAMLDDIPTTARNLYLHKVYIRDTSTNVVLYIRYISNSSTTISALASVEFDKVVSINGTRNISGVNYNIYSADSGYYYYLNSSNVVTSGTLSLFDTTITDTVTEL